MSFKEAGDARLLRMKKRGPFPFISTSDRLSPFSFSISLYYVPQVINVPHPAKVDLFSS